MTTLPFRIPFGASRPLRRVSLSTLLLAAGLVAAVGASAAETRIFLIENSDAYGVDTCLADGAPCGGDVANAWCRTHDYTQALDYGRIATAGTGTGIMTIAGGSAARENTCTGGNCEPVVAIACTK